MNRADLPVVKSLSLLSPPHSSSLSMRRLTHANEREKFSSLPLHPLSMGHLFSLFPSPVITLPHILRLSHHARVTYRRIKTFTTLQQLFWSSAVKLAATDWG